MTRRTALPLAAIALLSGTVCAIYFQSLASPFIFDDSGSVTGNRSIVRLWPLLGDFEHPGPLNPPVDLPVSGRPLVNLSLAINYYFGQLDPIGYHAFNLVVHVLSACLLMAIVRRTLRLDCFAGRFTRAAGPLAFIVALLWALHPLQTEPVAYITQRTELMVGCFYLATLYASLRYWEASSKPARIVWLAAGALACLAGMASKEVMVTAPVVVLLFERTFISGSFRRTLQRSWPLYVGLFVAWGLLFWLNWSAPRSSTAGFHVGVPAYAWWFTQAKFLWIYLKLAVFPWPLAIYYQVPYVTTLGAAWPWLVATAFLVLAVLVLCWRRSAIGFAGALGAAHSFANVACANHHRNGGGTADVPALGGDRSAYGCGWILSDAVGGQRIGARRRKTETILQSPGCHDRVDGRTVARRHIGPDYVSTVGKVPQ